MSLKEQMLKAGLITEKQAKQADHKEKQRTKKTGIKGRQQEKKKSVDEAQNQLNAQRQKDKQREEADNARREGEEKARQEAQKRQSTMDAIFKDGQVRHWGGQTRYYYLNGKVVDYLLVKDDVATQLEQGQVAIAISLYGHPVPILLKASAATQLREIAPDQLLAFHRED